MTIFQMLIPVISSLVLTALFTPMFINYAHKKARTNDPQRRSKLAPSKSGYTNDGGFVFNLAIIVTGLWVPLGLHMLSPKILVLDFILLLYGFLGFLTILLSYGKTK